MITTGTGRWRRAGRAVVVAGLAGALGVAASAGPASARTARPQARTSKAQAAALAQLAQHNAVTVIAHDSSTKMRFNIVGSPHAGQVMMHFKNRGKFAHEMSLLRLKKHATLAQFKQALQQPDAETAANKLIVDPAGEIAGPALLGPGLAETVVAPLKAGHYVVICFLPGPDGMPHAMMGMIGGLKVTPANGARPAPSIAGTVQLTNHKIVLPRSFAGGGTFAVRNTGTRAHNLSLAKLDRGTSLPDLFGCIGQSFGAGTMIDKCPGALAGGISDLAPGQTAYLRITLPRGRYGYVSSDGNDFSKGLSGTFTVH